jgi:hypothetical protein
LKEGIEKKLVGNLVEITIPCGEVKEFQYNQNTIYKSQDISDDILTQVRKRKSQKYKNIGRNMKKWLHMSEDEIKRKFHVEKIEIKTYYIIISSLGVL